MVMNLPTQTDQAREFATQVVRKLRDSGHVAYWAGGCVRDLLLGLPPADYDVATDATPDRVIKIFRRTIHVGISFGVIRVLGDGEASEDVEVATFRSDGDYLDGRRPESITFGSAEADAARRDFTINGMFYDPMTKEVIDYVGGRSDLEAKILRAIGDPHQRFAEDKLRLLRAARFAARFDLAMDPLTREAVIAVSRQVTIVAAERIAQELRRMLTHSSRARGICYIRELRLLSPIFPDLIPVDQIAWNRTQSIYQNLSEHPNFPLSLAILLRDLPTELVEARCLALKLSSDEQARTLWLVAHQNALTEQDRPRVCKLKRLFAHPFFPELLDWWRAEGESKAKTVEFVDQYLNMLPDGPIDPPAVLNGRDLIAAGLRPGPKFAAMLDSVRDAQLEGEVTSRDAALQWIKDRF